MTHRVFTVCYSILIICCYHTMVEPMSPSLKPTVLLVYVRNYIYRRVPKFSDARKLCCNLLKIQTKSPNLRVSCQKDANGIANSEDPDQTAPLGAV